MFGKRFSFDQAAYGVQLEECQQPGVSPALRAVGFSCLVSAILSWFDEQPLLRSVKVLSAAVPDLNREQDFDLCILHSFTLSSEGGVLPFKSPEEVTTFMLETAPYKVMGAGLIEFTRDTPAVSEYCGLTDDDSEGFHRVVADLCRQCDYAFGKVYVRHNVDGRTA